MMLLCNEASMERFPEVFIKQIPIRMNTAYRLTFEQLGGSIGVWINRCFAETGARSHHFPACREWTTREVVFTTGNRVGKLEAFRNWGISFFKKNDSMVMCGLEDTFVDHVQLTTVDEPQCPLLSDEDWNVSRFDYIQYATEPQSDRRCLLFRSTMAHPPHPADISIQAHTFGCIKYSLYRITRRHPYGVPYHCLAFSVKGRIRLNEDNVHGNAETMFYFPPNTPFHYTFEHQEAAQYYWVEFGGNTAELFLDGVPLPPCTPIPLPRITALTAHIEQMLQQPQDSPLQPYTVSSHLQLLLTELRHQLCAENDDEQKRRIQAIAVQLQQSTLLPSNEELAAEIGFSTGHFIRMFKTYMGCTPHRYALRCRLEKARELLAGTPMTVQEIAYAVGFEDPQYFSRTFRAEVGVSPREYRNNKRSE